MRAPEQDLAQLQYQFAAHIRNPQQHAKPADVEDRRMSVYRELFFNNIDGFISGGFPVLKSITDDAKWQALVRQFFDQHRCQTPYFLEIAGEFLSYINDQRAADASDFPFMRELAHYEWVELALDTSELNIEDVVADPDGDLLDAHPMQSPLAWSLVYSYPVHKICADFLPQNAPEIATYLIVYRNREDRVKFMAINQLTARLLYLLSEDEALTGRQALQRIAIEMAVPDNEPLIQGGLAILQQLRAAEIILGTSC